MEGVSSLTTFNFVLSHALAIVALRWAVFRLAPGSKVPIKGTSGFKDATLDRAQVEQWWGEQPDLNIGIATGSASGIFVLDVDPRNGGKESLAALEREHSKLPETPVVMTGGGGLHAYFRLPEGIKIRSSTSKLGKGLDIKADGGYVVGAGSIHPDGGVYEWAQGRSPDDVDVADAPAWLIELLAESSAPADAGEVVAGGTIPKGQRNTELLSLGGAMRRIGATEVEIYAALEVANAQRCQPPLPESEVTSIAHSVARYDPAEGEIPTRATNSFSDAPLGETGKFEFEVVTEQELREQQLPEIEWLVEGIIRHPGIATFSGRPGAGKSWLAIALAQAVSTGTRWLDKLPVRQGNVLLIDEENDATILQERLGQLSVDAADGLAIATMQDVHLDRPEHVEALAAYIEEHSPILVVVDSFTRIHSKDENSATEMASIFRTINGLRQRYRCSFVLIDHQRKSGHGDQADRLRGSIDKLASVDALLSVSRVSQDPLRMEVEHSKARATRAVPTFRVELQPVGGDGLRLAFIGEKGADDGFEGRRRVGQLILDALTDGPLTRDELIIAVKNGEVLPTKKLIGEALQQVVADKDVIDGTRPSKGPGRPATVFLLRGNDGDADDADADGDGDADDDDDDEPEDLGFAEGA